jgi:ABC-type lipoprotein release transport system permease subunit
VPLPLSYNWANVVGRKLSTGLTFLVVAVVVFVLALLLSFAAGIRASLVATGSPENVIVLKPGATAESTSILDTDEVARLVQTPNIAQATAGAGSVAPGTMLISQELCVQTNVPRLGTGVLANVAVRGVDEVGYAVHREVHIANGRAPRQGAMEVVVGAAAQRRFQNLEVGDKIKLGRSDNREFEVVGVFDAQASALESEIWAPRTSLADVYMARYISSVCIKLNDVRAVPDAVEYITGSTVKLQGKPEPDYYRDLSSKTRDIVAITTVLISIMGIGAVFAVMNTMFSAVDARRREIAMLRTIGFGRASILSAFMLEAVLICVTACGVGLAASMFLHGAKQDYLSDSTWTVLAYELRITPGIVAAALCTALAVGLVGAFLPALRAARTQVLQAMRKG